MTEASAVILAASIPATIGSIGALIFGIMNAKTQRVIAERTERAAAVTAAVVEKADAIIEKTEAVIQKTDKIGAQTDGHLTTLTTALDAAKTQIKDLQALVTTLGEKVVANGSSGVIVIATPEKKSQETP